MSDGSSRRSSGAPESDAVGGGLRRKLARALFAFDPPEVTLRLERCEAAVEAVDRSLQDAAKGIRELQLELELLRDERVPTLESRADSAEEAIRDTQTEVAQLRDGRIREMEDRLDTIARQLAEAVEEIGVVRDERLPAAVARQDLLVERLAREQDELASLVERILQGEPLPVPAPSPAEDRLAGALESVQPVLLREFRGTEDEISHRLERYLPLLKEHAPVLDLGCGRGELLLLLREAGIEAAGVEADPALAAAARRRGLGVRQADVLSALRGEEDGSRGAVTAIHILEHLDPATLLELLAEVRRILRPDGVLIVECPNPHSLRVGAALFWLDPTHLRPLLPETLALFLRASGFSIESTEYLHPFPESQSFVAPREDPADTGGAAERLARLESRLDAILNGFRDFSIVARNAPGADAGGEGV